VCGEVRSRVFVVVDGLDELAVQEEPEGEPAWARL